MNKVVSLRIESSRIFMYFCFRITMGNSYEITSNNDEFKNKLFIKHNAQIFLWA